MIINHQSEKKQNDEAEHNVQKTYIKKKKKQASKRNKTNFQSFQSLTLPPLLLPPPFLPDPAFSLSFSLHLDRARLRKKESIGIHRGK